MRHAPAALVGGCHTVNPEDVRLPEKIDALKMMYILVNCRLNNIWYEYTNFVETLAILPKTNLIFPIIFSELDFYENLLQRIAKKLPEDIKDELKSEFFFTDW